MSHISRFGSFYFLPWIPDSVSSAIAILGLMLNYPKEMPVFSLPHSKAEICLETHGTLNRVK